MTTGDRMKKRRKELGLSAEIVAEKLGVSPATIYRYEKGDIEKLPGNMLAPISSVLCTTPAYLMGWADDESGFALIHPPFASNPDGGKLLFYFKIDGDDAKSFLDSYQYNYPAVFRNDELSLEELKILYAWRRADEKARRKVSIDLEDYGFDYHAE